jgi:hypothetical protein
VIRNAIPIANGYSDTGSSRRALINETAFEIFAKKMIINKLGLYNPRKGLEFILPHEEFSIHFCGLSTEELCNRIGFELNSANPFYIN